MKLMFRADGGGEAGIGHLMRTLALAQEWNKTGDSMFLCAECPPDFEERLQAASLPLHKGRFPIGAAEDVQATTVLAKKYDTEMVCLDGYHFGSAYQSSLRKAGLKLAMIDDQPIYPTYDCDLLVNPSVIASSYRYQWRSQPPAEVLRGSEYALLRSDVLTKPIERRFPEGSVDLLVHLGGGSQISAHRVLAASLATSLVKLSHVTVLTPEAAVGELWQTFGKANQVRVEHTWLRDGMGRIYDTHDVALCAGGAVCWELAYHGLPAVAVAVNQSQVDILKALSGRSLIYAGEIGSPNAQTEVGRALSAVTMDSNSWSSLSNGGKQLVDGAGAERICQHLKAL